MSEFKNCFTIAIDMDDTIEDLLVTWIKWLNKEHNLNASIEDVKSYDMKDLYPELSSDEIYAPLFDDAFWYYVFPKDNASHYIKKLIENGQDVYIVTSSHYATIKNKIEAIIKQYFPFIDWQHIITTCNKQMIKCDIMIDDAPYNLENGEYVRVLFDAPHNQNYAAEENKMKRVHNWEETYNLIKDLDWFYYLYDIPTVMQ